MSVPQTLLDTANPTASLLKYVKGKKYKDALKLIKKISEKKPNDKIKLAELLDNHKTILQLLISTASPDEQSKANEVLKNLFESSAFDCKPASTVPNLLIDALNAKNYDLFPFLLEKYLKEYKKIKVDNFIKPDDKEGVNILAVLSATATSENEQPKANEIIKKLLESKNSLYESPPSNSIVLNGATENLNNQLTYLLISKKVYHLTVEAPFLQHLMFKPNKDALSILEKLKKAWPEWKFLALLIELKKKYSKELSVVVDELRPYFMKQWFIIMTQKVSAKIPLEDYFTSATILPSDIAEEKNTVLLESFKKDFAIPTKTKNISFVSQYAQITQTLENQKSQEQEQLKEVEEELKEVEKELNELKKQGSVAKNEKLKESKLSKDKSKKKEQKNDLKKKPLSKDKQKNKEFKNDKLQEDESRKDLLKRTFSAGAILGSQRDPKKSGKPKISTIFPEEEKNKKQSLNEKSQSFEISSRLPKNPILDSNKLKTPEKKSPFSGKKSESSGKSKGSDVRKTPNLGYKKSDSEQFPSSGIHYSPSSGRVKKAPSLVNTEIAAIAKQITEKTKENSQLAKAPSKIQTNENEGTPTPQSRF